ncbi:MAG: response regulator [Thermoleophilia bacterium]|nr:response regulator [Thermoleophilia bacterium]
MGELSVLVVDDEEDFVDTLLKRLRRKGVECDGAYSGDGAKNKMLGRGFDVVLLDMRLADEDGNEVLKELQAMSPETRFLILSGYASASAGRAGIGCGAVDYLLKPVEFETLYEKIVEVC